MYVTILYTVTAVSKFHKLILCYKLKISCAPHPLPIPRILLEHGASTTLPDSNGCQINCPSFAGTQFLMETHRKEKKRKIMACLNPKASIKDIQIVWEVRFELQVSL